MNENELLTYSIIRGLSESEKHIDYIDIFCTFVLRIIPNNTFVKLDEIKNKLVNTFNFHNGIPNATLETIMTRAKRCGYVTVEQIQENINSEIRTINVFQLSEKGKVASNFFDNEDDVKKRIQKLVSDIQLYWQNNKVDLNKTEIINILLTFIRSNINTLGPIIKNKSIIQDNKMLVSHAKVKYIIKYLNFIKDHNHKLYHVFREMVHGSIISMSLYSDRIDGIKKDKFHDCIVYLDSNFVFSVLGLHVEEECLSAKYLFKLLKQNKFRIKIFDFTIDEMLIVLKRFAWYLNNIDKYPPSNMNTTRFGLYHTLHSNGWTISKVKDFSDNLENILKKMNIIPEPITLNTRKECLSLAGLYRSRFEKFTPMRFDRSRDHDLQAIELIRMKRGDKLRRFESCKAFFLSSDTTLSRFDYINLDHQEDGSICEVILDKFLVNILWLKNPKIELPLETIISLYSRDLFVNKNIWDKFCQIIGNLLKSSKITQDDITQLFYDNYIEDILCEIEEEDVYRITEQYIKENIKEARRRAKEDKLQYEKGKLQLEQHLNDLKGQLATEKQDHTNAILGIIDRLGERDNVIRNKIKKAAQDQVKNRKSFIIATINISFALNIMISFSHLIYDLNVFFISGLISIFVFLNLWLIKEWYPWNIIFDRFLLSIKKRLDSNLDTDEYNNIIKELSSNIEN